jgi:hypothetical protein
MTSREHIRNPVEWTAEQLWLASDRRLVGSLDTGEPGYSVARGPPDQDR